VLKPLFKHFYETIRALIHLVIRDDRHIAELPSRNLGTQYLIPTRNE
jgi:hypothetical protein